MDPQKLLTSIAMHECRGGVPELRAYQDSVGVWTIGYGRNLQTMRITREEADAWLKDDVQNAYNDAQKFLEFASLDTDARQNAFIEMVFNLGAGGVGKFKGMLLAIRNKAWETAADQALDSQWSKQVGKRAQILAQMIRTGSFPQ